MIRPQDTDMSPETLPTCADGTPVIEAWSDPAITAGLFDGVIAKAIPEIPKLEAGFLFATTVYDASYRQAMHVIAAHNVQPHIDVDFDPWTVLVIHSHGDGHQLCAADAVPRNGGDFGRVPRTKPYASVPLRPGLIVLFNGHRLHWLPKIKDRTRLLCASFSFDARPSRETVKARILADLAPFALADAA